MTTEYQSLIQNQLSRIVTKIEKNNSEGDFEGLYSKLILSINDQSKILWNVNCTDKWIDRHKSTMLQGNYVELATLGIFIYQIDAKNAKEIFTKGVEQLMKRDSFPTDRISFVFHPRMFFGLVLGVKSLSADSQKDKIHWLQEMIKKRQTMADFDTNAKLLYLILESLLFDKQILIDRSIIDSFNKAEQFSIVYWAYKKGLFVLHNPEENYQLVKREILSKFSLEELDVDEVLLPFIYFSVTNIVLNTIDSILLSLEHVSKILSNFNSGMERWTWKKGKQWKIEDEYDVQNILYLILRSYFDDAEYEDPTPKFGSSSSRLDVKIPSLQTIIEAKFARSKKDFKKIEDEIKIDSVNYIQSTPYKKIIVFIYDNSQSTQVHQRTINALKQIEPIKDIIVVSRPSHMISNLLKKSKPKKK